jgi:hypothetical protein
MVLQLEIGDYEAWKPAFDADPVGRRQIATGHVLSRGVDNPDSVFIRVSFKSVEDAQTFRQRLLESGALNNPNVSAVVLQPTVIDPVEEITY